MKRNHSIWKIAVALIALLFVCSSAVQAIANINQMNQPLIVSKKSVTASFNPLSSDKNNAPSLISLIMNFFENLRTWLLQSLGKYTR